MVRENRYESPFNNFSVLSISYLLSSLSPCIKFLSSLRNAYNVSNCLFFGIVKRERGYGDECRTQERATNL